jgi:hypothetical protein
MMKNIKKLGVGAGFGLALALAVPLVASAAAINVPADQSTIQAAVNAASTGDTVNVAAGTYTETVTVNTGVSIVGASGADLTGEFDIHAANTSISGFSITNPNGDFGILISGVGSVNVSNNTISGIGTSVNGTNVYGVWFQSSGSTAVSDIAIENNVISNIGNASNPKTSGGIGIGDSTSNQSITSGLVISGNTISSVLSSTKGAYGIILNLGANGGASITGASITGNDISALTGGWEHAIGLETNTPSITLTNNVIHGLTAGPTDIQGIHFEVNPSAPAAVLTGNTLDGNPLSNSNASVRVNSAVPVIAANTYPEALVGGTYYYIGINLFPTIQAGVTGVANAGTVNVDAGTYSENVTIPKPLALTGANIGTTGTSTVRVPESIITDGGSGIALSINSDNVTVDGFTVEGASSVGVFNSAADHNVVIRNNVITDNSIGMYPNCAGNCLVQHNEFKSNNRPGAAGGAGIYTDQGTNGLTIDQNDFTGHLNNSAIIFAATSPTTNANDVVTNNTIENNNSSNSMIYVVSLTGGTFSGNIISQANTNAIKFAGADSNITLTGNVLTNSGDGIKVSDDGFGFGNNSNIVAHGNDLTGNTTAGVENASGYVGQVDATGNWWGDASGPNDPISGDGSTPDTNAGTGSPAVGAVNYGSQCVNAQCTVPVPTSAMVHIFKYLDGSQATADTGSANGVSFPMFTSTYNAPFALGPSGWTAGDAPYEASTAPMPIGSSYSANEDTSTALVGDSCDGAHQYALDGYSVGDTLLAAQTADMTDTIPSFPNLQGDEYIIVHNETCAPVQTIKVHILKYLDNATSTSASASGYQFPMTSIWTADNLNGGSQGSGTYVLGNSFGGAADQYGADTAAMNVGADYSTNEITSDVDSSSQVVPNLAACSAGKYYLAGYSSSNTSFADAFLASSSTVPIAFDNLQTDGYIIVWNNKCPTTATLTVTKMTIGGNGTFTFTGDHGIGTFTITTSGNSGTKTFADLAPGTYTITETSQKGWTQTADSSCTAVVLDAGETVNCIITNTNNKSLGSIRGTKYEDWDGDGKPFETKWEEALKGFTIYLDTNNNNQLDSGEPTSVTDKNGLYYFVNLPAGTYHVREVQKDGWISTYPSSNPANDEYTVNLSAGQNVKKKDFGNFKLGTISGMKFNDKDGDGRKDAGEGGLSGIVITLKGPKGLTLTTTTAADGSYSFTGLKAGTYTLSETVPSGWRQTVHPQKVEIDSGTVSKNNNFGDTQKPLPGKGGKKGFPSW